MKRLAVVLALAVAGCGTPGPQAYEGPARPAGEIGILKGLSAGYRAGFASYARREVGQKIEFTSKRSFGQGYPNEVHLLPGRYLVLLHCNDGRQYGFPAIELALEAGMTYEIGCRQPIGEAQKIQAFLFRSFATTPKP
jgi:hypothetical protein